MFNFLAPEIKSFDVKSIFSNMFSQWYYYLALLIIIAVVVVFVCTVKPQKKTTYKKTYFLSIMGVMIALTVIANIFSFGSNLWKVSFVPTICFICGFLFGPLFGFATGFLGDLIAGIIAPLGVYNPIIGIASGLWGFFPGLFLNYFRGNDYVKTVIAFLIGYVVSSICLNTIATYLMYLQGSKKYPTLFSYVISRMGATFVTSFVLNCVISMVILKPLKRIKERLSLNHQITET